MEQQSSTIDQVARKVTTLKTAGYVVARKVTLKTAGYVAGFQGGVWALWILWDYAPWSRIADQLQSPNIGLQLTQVVIGTAVSFLMIWLGGAIAWRSIKRQLISMRSQDKRASPIDQLVRKLSLYTAGYVAGFQGSVWALWILWDYAPWSRFADQLQLPNISILWDYAPWFRFVNQLQLPNIVLQLIQVVIGTAVSFLMVWVGGSIAWRSIKRQLIKSLDSSRRPSTQASAISFVTSAQPTNLAARGADGANLIGNVWVGGSIAWQSIKRQLIKSWDISRRPSTQASAISFVTSAQPTNLAARGADGDNLIGDVWVGGSIAWQSIKRQLIKSWDSSPRPSTQASAISVASAQPTNLTARGADGDDLVDNEGTDQLNRAEGNDQIFGYADLDMRNQEKRNRQSWTIRKQVGIGLAAIVGLFGGVGAWATTFDISGAVIGQGQVQASATRIAVQHQVGGVVAEILANNGDKVKSGDVVIRLDDSLLRSDLATNEGELFEILANEARLQAEVDDRKAFSLHPVLQEAVENNPGLKPLLDRQQRQLEAYHESLRTQVSLLQERTNQIRDEAVGVQAALDAKREGLAFSEKELAAALQNLDKGIITKAIVVTLQKEVIVGKGDVGSLTAKVAELKGKQAEQQLAIYATPLTMRALSADKLNLLKQQSNKLIEARSGILYKLGKLDVRAPVSGMVFDSKVLGPRSVIEPAKPIMYIVPDSQRTLVVVRVEAKDIDQVRLGQEAGLRFTSFNRRSTPIVEGRVTAISADAFADPVTHSYYYFADVSLSEGELQKLGHGDLIPGMPVEAFLTTTGRSPASYAIKPIADYFARALRD